MGRVSQEGRRHNIKVPEEADQEPPRAGPKGKALPWDKIRILSNGMVRLGSIGVYGRGSVSARAAHRPTSHCAGTSGTAKIRIACVRFVAGRQPNASGAHRRIPKNRQRHASAEAARRQRQRETPKTAGQDRNSRPQEASDRPRGHAAKIILQIFAIALGAMNRHAPPIERHLAIVAMIAARRSGVYAIVNASG